MKSTNLILIHMKNRMILGLVCMLVFSSYNEKSVATVTFEIKNFDPDLLKIRGGFGSRDWRDHKKNINGGVIISLPIDKPCIRYVGYPDYTTLFAQPIDIALSTIDSKMAANTQYFEKLAKGKPTIPAFTDYIKASILYSVANQKLTVLNRQKPNDVIKYYAFLNNLSIENAQYTDIPDYQWFLSTYLSMETNKRYEKLDSMKRLSTDAYFEESLKVIEGMKNQHVREFALASIIYDRLQENGVKNFHEYHDYFTKHNQNPRYSHLISKEQARKQLLAPGKPAPSFALNDVDGNRVSLTDFKGKYVLIDFWQTLCPRSARELPHYLKLYDDYKDENIAFVSISINQDEKVWREYVKAKKNVGTSLRTEKYFDAKEYIDYQVPGLPFFVIIDQEGKIIVPAAAKPSSKEMRETLDKLLKSK